MPTERVTLYNNAYMRKQNIGKVRNFRLYDGNARQNLQSKNAKIAYEEACEVKSEKWLNSASRDTILQERNSLNMLVRQQLQNASGYDPDTIQRLAGLYAIDMIRQADDYTDYTPILFHEQRDEEAAELVTLRDYLPYIGKEEDMEGTGDKVPLMQHKLPEIYSLILKIRGFGDKSAFRELVFNPFHTTENVISSAARILADEKNADSITPIVKATYDPVHSQAPITTGATLDLNIYNTLQEGIDKALRLICKPIGKANGLMRQEVYLLVNNLDGNRITKLANGALQTAGGLMQNVGPLPIEGIIPYAGGLNDGLKYGDETLSYPGVEQGYVYAFVKVDVYGGYRIIKRDETMEVSAGDILALTSEKRLWYRIRGIHNDFVLPETDGSTDYGAVVKIELPS